jgi:hypothetical protein
VTAEVTCGNSFTSPFSMMKAETRKRKENFYQKAPRKRGKGFDEKTIAEESEETVASYTHLRTSPSTSLQTNLIKTNPATRPPHEKQTIK